MEKNILMLLCLVIGTCPGVEVVVLTCTHDSQRGGRGDVVSPPSSSLASQPLILKVLPLDRQSLVNRLLSALWGLWI